MILIIRSKDSLFLRFGVLIPVPTAEKFIVETGNGCRAFFSEIIDSVVRSFIHSFIFFGIRSDVGISQSKFSNVEADEWETKLLISNTHIIMKPGDAYLCPTTNYIP